MVVEHGSSAVQIEPVVLADVDKEQGVLLEAVLVKINHDPSARLHQNHFDTVGQFRLDKFTSRQLGKIEVTKSFKSRLLALRHARETQQRKKC